MSVSEAVSEYVCETQCVNLSFCAFLLSTDNFPSAGSYFLPPFAFYEAWAPINAASLSPYQAEMEAISRLLSTGDASIHRLCANADTSARRTHLVDQRALAASQGIV